MAETVAFLGAGMMGEAVLAGLLRAGADPADLLVVERRAERAEELTGKYGVQVLDAAQAVALADVLVVVVKPNAVAGLLAEIGPAVRPGTLVISLAAGIPLAQLEAPLPDGVAVARVMPNTPALVGRGVAAVSPGRHCGPEQVARVVALLSAVGDVVEVPEDQQDAVTAVSGSGPAYLFHLAEAMTDAGVLLGLARPLAARLVAGTLAGAAEMLADGHPTLLREQVASPGGTTIAALRALEAGGVRAAYFDALEAARDRSRELSAG